MADQGSMTSPTLNAMLQAAVARLYPGIPTEGLDKVGVLQAVMAAHGWQAVLELGRQLRTQASHPVVRAIAAGPTPLHIVERWRALERFGHSRHRTQILDHDVGRARMTLRHVALDGGEIHMVNNLFVWGLLVAILETAGFTELGVTLTPAARAPVVIHGDGARAAARVLHDATDVVTLRWRPTSHASPSTSGATAAGEHRSARTRLRQLLSSDLLHSWTLEDAARQLLLSRRSLQRALREEGTTFSEALQRARVDAAHALLGDARLTLTDVAFCTGFSDQAHFSRTFRRYVDVPPSALRAVVRSSAATSKDPV